MKQINGWLLDKSVDEFKLMVDNLKSEGQVSRAEAIEYLVERVKLAEEQLKKFQTKDEEYCTHCCGTGVILDEGEVETDCDYCDGTGKV